VKSMNKILIKAMRPHRQKILTEQGEEKRLQQWANQKAAEHLRGAGGDASGEQFEQARDALMREAVMNPEKYGLKFMGEKVPFEGQELMSNLSTPDVEGEMSSIDDEFRNPDGSFRFETEPPIVTSPGNTFNTPPKTPDVFDEQGNLRQGLKPQEEDEAEEEAPKRQHMPMDPDHPDYFKSSRRVAFTDAWSLLKSQ